MGFCPKCGTKVEDGSSYCPNCGYELNGGVKNNTNNSIFVQKPAFTNNQSNEYFTLPLSKAALVIAAISLSVTVLGFISMFASIVTASIFYLIYTLGVIGGIVSLSLSIPGLIISSVKKYNKSPAITALILSIINILSFILFLIIVFVLINDYK